MINYLKREGRGCGINAEELNQPEDVKANDSQTTKKIISMTTRVQMKILSHYGTSRTFAAAEYNTETK